VARLVPLFARFDAVGIMGSLLVEGLFIAEQQYGCHAWQL
jgi:hypothetical protein